MRGLDFNMSVNVTSGVYIDGLPVMDYTVHINEVSISLKKEDFQELIEQLGIKIKQDYDSALEVSENYNKKVKEVQRFRKDIIKIFYNGDVDDSDSFFFEKDLEDIDKKELREVLDKYLKILGFE